MDDRPDRRTLAWARPSEPAAPTAPAGAPSPPSSSASASPSASPSDRAARGPGKHVKNGAAPGEPRSVPSGKKQKNFWRELLTIVAVAAALTLAVKAFIVQVYRIPSASMENTLQVGDRVLVNKLVYHFRDIDRGDIIVFSGQNSWGPDAPTPSGDPVVRLTDDLLSDIGLASSQTYYIKRVIGLPGDHVACCTDGKVTVNDVPLTETSYLYPGDAPSFKFSVTVPPGHLWVMGDHRGDSDDSRYHLSDPGGGAIPENEVVGRAFWIIWPPSQVRDLPIPSTFGQPALHAGAALPAVASAPVPGTAAVAGVTGAPLLLLRRRIRRRRDEGH